MSQASWGFSLDHVNIRTASLSGVEQRDFGGGRSRSGEHRFVPAGDVQGQGEGERLPGSDAQPLR